jgi:hypothetical protein
MMVAPAAHTPEAPGGQLEILTANHPDALLVGSLGRSVILGGPLELRRRGVRPKH